MDKENSSSKSVEDLMGKELPPELARRAKVNLKTVSQTVNSLPPKKSSMTIIQKKLLKISGLVGLMVVLFPPVYNTRGGRGHYFDSFRFIFSSFTENRVRYGIHTNLWLMEIVGLIILVMIFFIIFQKNSKDT